jgi:DNA-binding CsgD family transcriptional regulator
VVAAAGSNRASTGITRAEAGGHPAAGRRPDRVHPPAPGVDLPRVQGRCEQAPQEAKEDAGTRGALLDHLAWVGIYRGDLAPTAGRGRGLLTAARGDLSAARSALEQALVEHRRVPQPFELARTLLVKGEVERRAKQKRAARSTLEQALGLFQALGAPFWAQRAQDDLARVGAAVPASSELTPTEQRIAQLVGEGKKNREVADALFISVKTVEANLSRIFHKLGVGSRTELTRRNAATHRVSPDSSPPHEG